MMSDLKPPDWADRKAAEIFVRSGSELQFRPKEQFLAWLAQELRAEAQHDVKALSSHAATTAALQQTTAALQQTTATLQQMLATFIADNAAFRAEVNRRFDGLEELVRSRSNGKADA